MRGTPAERFWAKTEPADDGSGCILWIGSKQYSGYGRFWNGNKITGAHQFAYVLAYGEIPSGLSIDHLCSVRNCVNVEHLEPVTHLENVRRGRCSEVQRARHAARTGCPQGHEYTPENTYMHPRGARVCRTCQKAHDKKRRSAK